MNMSKFRFFFAILLLFSTQINAKEIYKIDPTHTNINWRASHFGFSKPSGKFSNASGTIEIDKNNPQNSSVEISIDANSITTGLKDFDDHLKSADFFNVKEYPKITFKSSAITPYTKNKAKIKGHLTMLGINKIVTLNVRLNKEGINPVNKKQTIGFSASTKIKRSDFKMDFGLPGISNEVEITIEIEGTLIDKYQEDYSKDFMQNKNYKNTPIANWKIIPSKSKIEFIATQNNSKIEGYFNKYFGQVKFGKNKLRDSKVKIEIDTSSVSMPFSEALEAVKSADWLNTKLFSTAIFETKRIYPRSGPNQFQADSYLTLKGKKVPIHIEFNLLEYEKTHARIEGSAILKRSKFNIGSISKAKSQNVDDRVDVKFSIYAERI